MKMGQEYPDNVRNDLTFLVRFFIYNSYKIE